MAKIILGFAFGAITILLCLYFFYTKPINASLKPDSLQIDSIRTTDSIKGLNKEDFSLKIGITEEKISSINTRFNDLYILGSIILMLLLAIMASIYVKTASDVEKHLNDNFGRYKDQIIGFVTEAEQLVEKGKTEFDLMAKLRKAMEEGYKKLEPK
jgi:hypothetical protein